MNEIVIGIKPNMGYMAPDFFYVIEYVFFAEIEPYNTFNVSNAPKKLIRELYQGNQHVDSCEELYSGKKWLFYIIKTRLGFAEILNQKNRLRQFLGPYADMTTEDHPAWNSIHISDSKQAAEREVKLIREFFS
jgi:hypothetical protein